MELMDDPSLPAPPPSPEALPGSSPIERCYRHPDQETRVHCTRCGRPICPQCMVQAPVGHQCPSCVAEARREFRESPAQMVRTTARRATVTKVLLAAIVGMYIVEVAVGGPGSLLQGPNPLKLIDLGAAVNIVSLPNGDLVGIATGQEWRLFSSMFLHIGILHLALNAYALWLFGRMVERDYGSWRFLLLYFVSGFVAGAASYAFAPGLVIAAGASGAIFGVFGAFIAYNYRRRHTAMAAANLRSAVMLIVLNLVLAFGIQGIDWRAHLGGLVAGLVLGVLADEIGPRTWRTAISLAGFAVVAVAGVALVMWRTADLLPGA
jgi:membrane associated rhomboid family serine protease